MAHYVARNAIGSTISGTAGSDCGLDRHLLGPLPDRGREDGAWLMNAIATDTQTIQRWPGQIRACGVDSILIQCSHTRAFAAKPFHLWQAGHIRPGWPAGDFPVDGCDGFE